LIFPQNFRGRGYYIPGFPFLLHDTAEWLLSVCLDEDNFKISKDPSLVFSPAKTVRRDTALS
jgi:hypothetical protein